MPLCHMPINFKCYEILYWIGLTAALYFILFSKNLKITEVLLKLSYIHQNKV